MALSVLDVLYERFILYTHLSVLYRNYANSPGSFNVERSFFYRNLSVLYRNYVITVPHADGTAGNTSAHAYALCFVHCALCIANATACTACIDSVAIHCTCVLVQVPRSICTLMCGF